MDDDRAEGPTVAGVPAVVPPAVLSRAARDRLAVPRATSRFPALDDHAAWRAMIDAENAAAEAALPPPALATTGALVGGVTVWQTDLPPGAPPGDVVLLLHGGGLITGGGEVCRRLTALSAVATAHRTWGVDYRMPPEHPYPAALDDAVAVYRDLVALVGSEHVVVAGSSAGGNLAAALLLRARDERLPPPRALVLWTPEIDLTESGDSFEVLADRDPALSSLGEVNRLYAHGADLRHPYLSPLWGDVRGFPRTFVQAGTRDLFLSNAVRFHRKLREADVDAELHVFEAMPHGGFGGAPEDEAVAVEVRRFLQSDSHIDRP